MPLKGLQPIKDTSRYNLDKGRAFFIELTKDALGTEGDIGIGIECIEAIAPYLVGVTAYTSDEDCIVEIREDPDWDELNDTDVEEFIFKNRNRENPLASGFCIKKIENVTNGELLFQAPIYTAVGPAPARKVVGGAAAVARQFKLAKDKEYSITIINGGSGATDVLLAVEVFE